MGPKKAVAAAKGKPSAGTETAAAPTVKRNYQPVEDCAVVGCMVQCYKNKGTISAPMQEMAMTEYWPDQLDRHVRRMGWPATNKKLDPPFTHEWSKANRKTE